MNSYTIHITLYDLAFVAVIFTGLNFALLLAFAKSANQSANRFLALALMAVILWMMRVLAIDVHLQYYVPHWDWLPMQFLMGVGPLIYFYVLKVIRPEYIFKRRDWLHFSPLLLELAVFVAEITESRRTGAETYSTQAFSQLNPALLLLIFISLIIYLYLSYQLIENFYKRLRPAMMDRSRLEYRWLRRLLAGTALLWVLWAIYATVGYMRNGSQTGMQLYYPFYILFLAMIIWTAAAAFLKPQAGILVESSSLRLSSPDNLRQKGASLKRAMVENRYYQDPELSLNSLAERLGMHTHELSKIVNTVLKKSFNDFINEYRVKDVAQKMQDPAYHHITLLGIAFESGFNSQTTFNRTFKQITGKSPLEYKNTLKNKQPSYKLGSFTQSAPLILNQKTTPQWYYEKLTPNIMIKNYIKIAFRGFWRHRLFTLINIMGLSIGISTSLVIYLIVHYDFAFDKYHKDGDRIYRVVMNMTFQGQTNYTSGVPGPLYEAVKSQATGIEEITPLYALSPHFVYIDKDAKGQKRFKDPDRITLTDHQYFKIFNYVWLAGSPQHALDAPNQVVLTSAQARVYFPSLSYRDMIGKVVAYDTLKTTVSGIVETPVQNTDFTFHDFVSFATATANKRLATGLNVNNWNVLFSGSEVFLKLAPGASASVVTKQINTIFGKRNPPGPAAKGTANTTKLALQPLNDIHFNSNYNIFDFSTPANKTTLYGLLAIGGFLLLLACINFVNLTTAQASQRAKEVGIRKTLGASRAQFIVQFLIETFILTLFAVIVSALLAPTILKTFADFISPDIHANILQQPDVLIFLLILTIVVSVLSGFYPAMVLSGYRPVSVLKNQAQNDSSKSRSALLRKSLTVSQFVVAQFFLIATLAVSKQIYYALHKDLGFKKDAILVIRTPWKTAKASTNKVLMNTFQSMPQVALVSLGDEPPSSDTYNRTMGVYNDGKKQVVRQEVIIENGDENFIKVYQLKLLAGRNLQASDSGKAIIINNTYAKILGFTDPQDAIGKQMGGGFAPRGHTASIIGVVADYNQRSLHSPIYPSAIVAGATHGVFGMITLHVSLKPETPGGNEWKTAITNMAKAWKEAYPDDDFDYHFFDETIAKFYAEEQRTSILLARATGCSIMISCLGLLGLAIYTTGQRTKEIGIRKVFGASVAQIVTLLSTELISLILLAFVVATPVAWYIIHKWMQSFADRTPISWWVFVVSGAGMLLIGLLTLSFRTVKAGMANPVKSLRNE